jgi:hypothetical protein
MVIGKLKVHKGGRETRRLRDEETGRQAGLVDGGWMS